MEIFLHIFLQLKPNFYQHNDSDDQNNGEDHIKHHCYDRDALVTDLGRIRFLDKQAAHVSHSDNSLYAD